MNTSGIHPSGDRILIKPETVEKVSEGGIILMDDTTQKQGMAQVFGHLVDVGKDVWSDYQGAFAQIGDRVMFAKYGGLVVDGKDGEQYRLMNDTDITATVDEDLDAASLVPRTSISKQKEVA